MFVGCLHLTLRRIFHLHPNGMGLHHAQHRRGLLVRDGCEKSASDRGSRGLADEPSSLSAAPLESPRRRVSAPHVKHFSRTDCVHGGGDCKKSAESARHATGVRPRRLHPHARPIPWWRHRDRSDGASLHSFLVANGANRLAPTVSPRRGGEGPAVSRVSTGFPSSVCVSSRRSAPAVSCMAA